MSNFIRNPEGAIHSVPDDWEIPLGADDNPQEGWSEVDQADVPAPLLGSTTGEQLDPQVTAVHLHDLAAEAVADVPSSGHVGDDPEQAEPAAEPTVDEAVEAAQVPAQAGAADASEEAPQ